VEVAAGDWLFRQGDPGDATYVVRAGRVEVVDAAGGVLRVLGRGAALGELSLLTSSPRSASVRAARDSELIAIDHADFQELLRTSPPTALALTRVLGEQLRDGRPAAADARPRPVTIALVPLEPGVPLQEVAARLEEALRGHARVARLDGSEVAAPTDGTSPAAAYGPLLDRAEHTSDHVLLVCGPAGGSDPWTAFCLGSADRVLALSRGGSPPPGADRRAALRGCDLVAVDVAPGSGVLGAWAAELAPTAVHAVRTGAGFGGDVERVARRLGGRSLGIVLSGGGARAFCHIGVLEELDAAGIVIDRVAGVSMGAYVGGMYAMGMDGDEMDAHCYDEWVRRRPLADYTVPRHALIRGDRFEAMIKRVFGTVALEELPRGFLCAAADLRSGELVVRKGARNGASAAGKPRAPRVPPLGETVTRVLLMGSANTTEAARRHADVIITPRTDGVGLFEFHQLDRAREAGRTAARALLEDPPAVLSGA
jgi:predicted acylesterase/phospholipase RssA/CRP-like cAMP-binding protein